MALSNGESFVKRAQPMYEQGMSGNRWADERDERGYEYVTWEHRGDVIWNGCSFVYV